jgi:hypothetical protein
MLAFRKFIIAEAKGLRHAFRQHIEGAYQGLRHIPGPWQVLG